MDQVILTAYRIGSSDLATPKVVHLPVESIAKLIPIPANPADSRGKGGTTRIQLKNSDRAVWVYENLDQVAVAQDAASANPYAVDKSLGLSATGATQGTALALTTYFNEVTGGTTGSADGVKLPTAAANKVVVIANHDPFALDVWPETGDTVAGGAVNISTPQAAKSRKHYVALDATNWILAEE